MAKNGQRSKKDKNPVTETGVIPHRFDMASCKKLIFVR